MRRAKNHNYKFLIIIAFLFLFIFCATFYLLPFYENIKSKISAKQLILRNKNSSLTGYSMLVPSYKRRIKILNNFLEYTLNKTPKSLCEIIISWSSDENQIKQILNKYKNKFQHKNISLKYSIHTDQTVNRRFLDAADTKTNAILSIDDDIRMNPDDIEYGYQIWKKHSNQIVGYNKRFIVTTNHKNLKYAYWGSVPRLIITGIAFLSKSLCESYYSQNKENLDFVQKVNNCEDILINFVAMKNYNLPGIYVNREYKHLRSKGISSKQKNHLNTRSNCLNFFYKSFGKLPLPITNESFY